MLIYFLPIANPLPLNAPDGSQSIAMYELFVLLTTPSDWQLKSATNKIPGKKPKIQCVIDKLSGRIIVNFAELFYKYSKLSLEISQLYEVPN